MSTIAVILPEGNNWFFRQVLEGARSHAVAAGCDVIEPARSTGADATLSVADRVEASFADPDNVGAIVAAYQHWGDDHHRLTAWTRPIVVVGGSVRTFPVVSVDDVGVAREMTLHLLQLGHRRVVHLTGALDHGTGFIFQQRRAKGYRMTMEAAGLVPVVVESGLDAESLRSAVRTLLDAPSPPTAIFAVNDYVAFAVLEVAEQIGIEVGSGLSVAGINDHPRAEALGLTTIRQRPDEVGAMAVDMVLESMTQGSSGIRSRLHPTSLITRSSTKPPLAPPSRRS